MTSSPHARGVLALFSVLALAVAGLVISSPLAGAVGRDAVVLTGDLQTELGCTTDWQADCSATELTATGTSGVYARTFSIPAGTWKVKAAIGGNASASYGLDGGSEEIPLALRAPTKVRVQFDTSSHRVSVSLPGQPGAYSDADATLASAPYTHPGAGQNFYFALTDRFANGNAANDTGGRTGDRLTTGFDPTSKNFYEGGDLAGMRQKLDYIQGLGTTAIWLSPAFTNKAVQGTGDSATAGYHGYWITDFTSIDPHLGTNEEMKALIADAHKRGIKVYFDIVANHTADLIDYEGGDHTYVDQATAPYKDAQGKPVDISKVAGSSSFPTLDANTSFPHKPVRSAQNTIMKPAALNDVTMYHNRGNTTWGGESNTLGDFDGLDDLMTEDPRVVSTMESIYETWMDFGIDGYRIDTVKHVNLEFWQHFTKAVTKHQSSVPAGKKFFTFGEVYDADPTKTSPYVRDTDMNGVLDFPYQSATLNFSKGGTAAGMHSLFDRDDYYTTPHSSAGDLPTFLGNHDMGRVGYLLQGTDQTARRDDLAHELLYLTRGQPVVYAGDEQGFVGDGKDSDSRQSMFASKVPGYLDDTLVDGKPYGNGDHFDTKSELYGRISKLAKLRQDTPALKDGAQIELHADTGAGVYAFARVDRTEKVEHLVAANNSTQDRTVSFSTLTPGARYSALYGTDAKVTADADGELMLTVPALSTVVLKADRKVADSGKAQKITLTPAPGAKLSGQAPITAQVAGHRYAETSFAYRLAGDTKWTSLGTASDDTPRVFHDVTALPAGTVVEYRAVSTDADGSRVAASTVGVVGADLGVEATKTPATEKVGKDDVVLAGTFGTALGCTADWDATCAATKLTKDASGRYTGTFDLIGGTYEYKVTVGGAWDTNYGKDGAAGGENISLTHTGGPITFTYDPATHQVTTS